MKLINADAIITALESFSDRAHGNQHFLNGIETAKELIAEADEAVVRCKECKWWVPARCTEPKTGRCKDKCTSERPDAYCYHGERGTNETD